MNAVTQVESQIVATPLLPRCVLFLEEPFYQEAGETFCGLTWWRFADRLAAHAEALTLCVPMGCGCGPEGTLRVQPQRLRIKGRLLYRRTEEFYFRFWQHRLELRRLTRTLLPGCDLVIIRAPSPPGLSFARAAWRMGKPTVLLVAGDIRQASAYANVRGPKAAVARWVAARLRRQELSIARRSAMVGVWGQELLPLFFPCNPRTAVCAAPNMSQHDICRKADTMTGNTVRIIRVARILPNKGIEYLLDAVAILRRQGRDVCLDVAGGADDATYQQQLLERCTQLGIAKHVRFHGVVEFGQRLFDLYRHADVHIVSSISEGLPRCVVEGRALGLPTIATRVGGLPTVVHHEEDGLLVEPSSAEEIARAVVRLAEDGDLRRRIIAAGYRFAETQTAQFQAHRLAVLIAESLRGADIAGWACDTGRIGPRPGGD